MPKEINLPRILFKLRSLETLTAEDFRNLLKQVKDCKKSLKAEKRYEKLNFVKLIDLFVRNHFERLKGEKILSYEDEFCRVPPKVNLNPVRLIDFEIRRVVKLMSALGFLRIDAREIVSEEDNFDNLLIDKEHPAREEHGFFKLELTDKILRSHLTSSHSSEGNYGRSIDRIFLVGRVYRDDKDSTHLTVFHQLEWLVKENWSLMRFLRIIKLFLGSYLDEEVDLKMRPSYFPFTFMSFELDVIMDGVQYEIGGAGFMHPNILRREKIKDYESKSWPAMAFGIERLIMIKYGFKDIRECYREVNR